MPFLLMIISFLFSSAWFEEFKLGDYIPYIFANKMDGLLFVNLQDADWGEMKIINKIHIRYI
jgi:hypothetical protein